MRVVVATGNRGKLGELTALLAPLGVDLLPQSAYGVEPPPETGTTFLSNALIKARHAARVAQLPAVADDSGLEVDALGGAPGVYSARYAGKHGDAAANNTQLLANLAGVADAERSARFVCALAFVSHADDPLPVIAEGQWVGRILDTPAGDGGFGYDPLFFDATQGMSAAAMPAALKNRLSHRAQALQQLRAALLSRGIATTHV